MNFFHFLVLGLGNDVHLAPGSLKLHPMSCLHLGNVSLEPFVLLIRRNDSVCELLTDDVGDVVALLVTFVQQLHTDQPTTVRGFTYLFHTTLPKIT